MANEATPLLSSGGEVPAGPVAKKDGITYCFFCEELGRPDGTGATHKQAALYAVREDPGAGPDLIDNNAMLFKLLEIPANDQPLFESGLEKVGQWTFDAITYHQMLSEQGFIILCLKIISAHVSVKQFGVAIPTLIEFIKEIYGSTQREPHPLHNATHVIDALQALHFFLGVGNIKHYFTEPQLFALIVACLICDYNHPYLVYAILLD